MKHLIFTIGLLSFVSQAFSQDSIKIRTEIDTFNTPQYKSDYAAFFLKQQPQKFMFKGAATSILRDYGFLGSGGAFIPEVRLAEGVSLNLAFSIQTYYVREEHTDPKSTYNIPIQLYIEPRYYLHKKREIAQKLSADNFIGAYTGIRSGLLVGPAIKGTTYFAEAVLGSQQLFFLKTYRGLYKDYVDFNIGLGASHNTTDKWKPSYHIGIQFGGLFENLGERPKNNSLPAMCDVFQCYIEEKHLLKIDLLNLINISTFNNTDNGLDINYEEKISNSVFSINTGVNGILYNFKTDATKNKNIKGYTFKGYVEPRWYYKMKVAT